MTSEHVVHPGLFRNIHRVSELYEELVCTLAELEDDPTSTGHETMADVAHELGASLATAVAERRAERAPGSGVNIARRAAFSLALARWDFAFYWNTADAHDLEWWAGTGDDEDREVLARTVALMCHELEKRGLCLPREGVAS